MLTLTGDSQVIYDRCSMTEEWCAETAHRFLCTHSNAGTVQMAKACMYRMSPFTCNHWTTYTEQVFRQAAIQPIFLHYVAGHLTTDGPANGLKAQFCSNYPVWLVKSKWKGLQQVSGGTEWCPISLICALVEWNVMKYEIVPHEIIPKIDGDEAMDACKQGKGTMKMKTMTSHAAF